MRGVLRTEFWDGWGVHSAHEWAALQGGSMPLALTCEQHLIPHLCATAPVNYMRTDRRLPRAPRSSSVLSLPCRTYHEGSVLSCCPAMAGGRVRTRAERTAPGMHALFVLLLLRVTRPSISQDTPAAFYMFFVLFFYEDDRPELSPSVDRARHVLRKRVG